MSARYERVPVTVDEMVHGDPIVGEGWTDEQADTFVGRHPGRDDWFAVIDNHGQAIIRTSCGTWFKLVPAPVVCANCGKPIYRRPNCAVHELGGVLCSADTATLPDGVTIDDLPTWNEATA